ncbi:hypothetical protein Tco_0707799, partial [Tanacetum coccineum]
MAYPLPLDTAYRSSGTESKIIDFRAKNNFFLRANPADIFTLVTGRTYSHQLRIKVFPLSLADDAKEWWISEGDGKITTWEELVEKFFYRFYPESYDREDEMLDEGENWGIDPLEFLSNVNTTFKNHKKFDGRTQKLIFHSWMNGNWNKRYVDNNTSSNNEWKESKN